MKDINYTLLEIIKFNQQLSEGIELAFLEFDYSEDKISKLFEDIYISYKDGFLNTFINLIFVQPKKVKKSLNNFFSNYEKNKFKSLIDKTSIKRKLKYLNVLIDSYDSVFSLIYMLIINENEDIEKDLIKLQETSQQLYIANLCFVCLNLLAHSFNIANDKENNYKHSNKEIKNILKILVYCCNLDYDNDALKKLTTKSFEMFIVKDKSLYPNAKEFNDIYKLCSNECIRLEQLKTKLFEAFTKKIKQNLDNK